MFPQHGQAVPPNTQPCFHPFRDLTTLSSPPAFATCVCFGRLALTSFSFLVFAFNPFTESNWLSHSSSLVSQQEPYSVQGSGQQRGEEMHSKEQTQERQDRAEGTDPRECWPEELLGCCFPSAFCCPLQRTSCFSGLATASRNTKRHVVRGGVSHPGLVLIIFLLRENKPRCCFFPLAARA